MRIVLFDIDGTLLWSDGMGRRAMEGALVEVFGPIPPPADYRYDGKTDRQIVREVMRAAGRHDRDIDARMPRLVASYLARLERELSDVSRKPHLYAGVPELLDALEARDDVVLGLLTGNIEQGAALKLRAVGIDLRRFRVGAFGSDHEHRPELPAFAQRRARALLGVDVAGHQLVVIGDTPADIECGRSLGARAIAVATGRYTVDELSAYSPAAVFPDLCDTDAVMRVIFGATRDA
jgi:phosphoglycolate phosphatase